MSSEWPLVQLADQVESCLGKMLDAKKNRGVLQPYLGNSNVRWGKFDLSDLAEMRFEAHEDDRYSLRSGDLVVCEGGEPGRCAIWNGPAGMKIQKALHRIRPKETLDNYYLFYWFCLAARTGHLEAHFTGTTIKHLTGKAIAALRVPLPPINIQRAMVNALRSLDDRIALLRETNATLEAIAQALFKSWFVDFDPVRAKAEGLDPDGMDAATAALFPDCFEESSLGEIPLGWSVKLCQEIIEVRDGTHASPKPSDVGYPLVTSRHITSGDILLDEAYLISVAEYMDISRRSKVDYLDILITMIGTVGSPAFVLDKAAEFAIKNIGLFKSSKKPEFSYYLYLLLKSNKMQRYLEGRMAGTTQKYLSLKALREISVLEPSIAVIGAFSEVVSPIFTKIHQANTQAKVLTQLRDTLMPRLMSGQMYLPEAEAQIEEVCA